MCPLSLPSPHLVLLCTCVFMKMKYTDTFRKEQQQLYGGMNTFWNVHTTVFFSMQCVFFFIHLWRTKVASQPKQGHLVASLNTQQNRPKTPCCHHARIVDFPKTALEKPSENVCKPTPYLLDPYILAGQQQIRVMFCKALSGSPWVISPALFTLCIGKCKMLLIHIVDNRDCEVTI